MSRGAKLASTVFIGLALLAVFFPQVLAPGDPLAVNNAQAFQAPSLEHPFGTDESGRDMYTRVIHGTADSLFIGLAATVLGMGVALALGVVSAIAPRWLDTVIMRGLDVLYAIPALLLALVMIAFTGPGTTPAIIAVGLSTAPGYARLIRTQLRTLIRSEMIEAATVLGHSTWLRIRNHLVPNTLTTLMALITLGIGQAVVWASALSFLGLGTPPPAPEWGSMLAQGRNYLQLAWWLTVFPGLAIVAVAAGATLVGRTVSNQNVK